jgi:hypothetical protein
MDGDCNVNSHTQYQKNKNKTQEAEIRKIAV